MWVLQTRSGLMVPNFMWGEPPTRHYLCHLLHLCDPLFWCVGVDFCWSQLKIFRLTGLALSMSAWPSGLAPRGEAGGFWFASRGDYSSWTHYFHYFPASHSRAHWQMDTDRLWISRLRRQIATVPLPSSTSRKSRRDFPGPGVFSENFKWCGQPLFSTSSILFPSISINDQWCRETANKNQPSAQAILQPFFSHWSAGWLNVWMTFVYPPWYFPSRLALTSWRNWSIGRGRDPFETTPSTVPWRVFMGWGSWYFEDVFSDHGEDW